MWESPEILNVLNTRTLKEIFWKTKTFFKKLEYCLLVESTKIKNTTFPHKTALSEDNVKTKRMGSAKWMYHKEQSFLPVPTFLFWKFCSSIRTSYKEFILCISFSNVHIHTFSKCWSFIWECIFLWVLFESGFSCEYY